MISVIIPTFNEKKNITKIAKKLSKVKVISEVIFVDDNSTDGTFEQIIKIKNKNKFKGLSRISNERDLCKSVLLGVKKSKKNVVLVMDCDLQHETDYIKQMNDELTLSKNDIIVASRFVKINFVGNLGVLRSLASNLAIYSINIIFGKKTSDPLSGFFICKKKFIINYEKFFFKKGYKILFDIIYNGSKKIRVDDFPIVFKKRRYEKSKFSFRVIWLFMLQMLHTKFLVKK